MNTDFSYTIYCAPRAVTWLSAMVQEPSSEPETERNNTQIVHNGQATGQANLPRCHRRYGSIRQTLRIGRAWYHLTPCLLLFAVSLRRCGGVHQIQIVVEREHGDVSEHTHLGGRFAQTAQCFITVARHTGHHHAVRVLALDCQRQSAPFRRNRQCHNAVGSAKPIKLQIGFLTPI